MNKNETRALYANGLKNFKAHLRLYVLLLLAFLLFNSSYSQQKKPNIIIILADDLGYGDLGSYGQKLIHTPNIDALASGGMRFTNYYSGCSVCAPSRETLLTGKHTGHTYIRGNFLTDKQEDPALPDEKMIVAEYLKKAGYHTALIGKWGLGGEQNGPEKQGFDYTYGYLDQIKAHNYYPPFLYETGKKIELEENRDGAKGVYSHDLIVQKTMDYLNDIDKKQPFFLYLPYTIPHGEYSLPPDTPYINNNWQSNMKVYATMISKLDKDIGRIMKVLKQKGVADNTLIFFASDNGANAGFARFFKSNGPFNGSKFGLYEGGIRVPMIAYWPGKIKPATVSNHISASWDLLPTICQATGIPSPAGIDGISLLPELTGKKQADHSYLYWEYFTYNYNWNKPENNTPRNYLESIALRMGKWKAIKKDMYKDKNAPIALYNLETDPGEKNDVANENPEIIKKITDILPGCTIDNAPYFPYKKQTN